MRVCIVNHYHDSNKGSCAILSGLIRRLVELGIDQISVASFFPLPVAQTVFRHTLSTFPQVELTESAWPLRAEYRRLRAGGRPVSRVVTLLEVGAALGRLVLARDGEHAVHRGVRCIAQSDLVLERGGPFFFARRGLVNPSLFKYSYPFLLAMRLERPFAFAPGGFGPFESGFSSDLIRRLCASAKFVMARDPISVAELERSGVDRRKVILNLDSGFWIEPAVTPRLRAALADCDLRGDFMVVTTRPWERPLQERYHQELARTIDSLVPKYFPRAVLVPHVLDPYNQIPDDRSATREVYDLLHRKQHVSIIEHDLTPAELGALYERAALVLGTRLHSVILALAAGTPAIAVSYAGHKARGVMEAVGLRKFVLDLSDYRADDAIELAVAAADLRGVIAPRIRELRQAADKDFRRVLLEAG